MITVFGIDVGSYSNTGHFAWYELTGSGAAVTPTPNSHCKNPVELGRHVTKALERDDEVAVGLEAPLWMPSSAVLRSNPPSIAARFQAERSYPWYAGAGATVGMMALTILGDVLAALQGARPDLTVTDDVGRWRDGTRPVLVYESFLPGKNRPASCCNVVGDEWDAFVSAALLFEILDNATHLRACVHSGGLQRLHEDALPHTPLWVLACPPGTTLNTGVRPPITVGWF